MSDLPAVVVVFLTYQRTDYAVRTIRTVRANMRYAGQLVWYVADDGSTPEHMSTVAEELAGVELLGFHSQRMGYGASANKAWYQALQFADLSLWLEDDWECKAPFDLTPYARLLLAYPDVGMIRFAHMPIDLHGWTCGYDGEMYLRIDWDVPYAFSGNPALRHRRAREVWGAYPEGLKPGETEVAYDWQVRQAKGPSIVWPFAVGEWGAWGHIGAVQSYQ